MKKRWIAALMAALMLALTGCGPLDLSTLGNNVAGGVQEEEIIVYEDDNLGEVLQMESPTPIVG